MTKIKLSIIAVILAISGIGLMTTPAHASTEQNCDTYPKCLNLWFGGSGSGYINAYNAGVTNDNVAMQFIPGRCNAIDNYDSDDYETSANCPYSGVPAGQGIFQLVTPNGCIGDYNNSNTDARAGGFDGCNSLQTGYGGGYGTVFFAYGVGCDTGYNGYDSFHWTSAGIIYDDTNGAAVYLNGASTNCMQESQF